MQCIQPNIYIQPPQERLEAVDKIFSNNCVYSTSFYFIPLICKFLYICYMYRTVEAVGLCFCSSKVCLYMFLLKIGLSIKIAEKTC